MRPPNYHQARKQKEQSRKLRQQEKQQRRTARVNRGGETDPARDHGTPEVPPERPPG